MADVETVPVLPHTPDGVSSDKTGRFEALMASIADKISGSIGESMCDALWFCESNCCLTVDTTDELIDGATVESSWVAEC